jgi:hypothetical protein
VQRSTFLLLLTLVAALGAAPPAAGATRTLGVGEQASKIFTDDPWLSLGLRDVRLVVSWTRTATTSSAARSTRTWPRPVRRTPA